jgi:short-subunit dehydrogenase
MSSVDHGTCLAEGSVQEESYYWSIFSSYLYMVLAMPTILYLLGYLIPQVYMACIRSRNVPNLQERYQAKWALVTGAGSGIGRSIAFKLASQGLNVVLVSLDDDCLKGTTQDLSRQYPKLSFRPVGINFAPGVPYLDAILQATRDLKNENAIQIVFNNAGFMVTGFLDQTPLPKLLANMECNATAAVQISHHFVQTWVKEKRKGCIVFTSSVAAFIPTPFAAMYASTKAFVSQFAACLHIEVQALGIDVCAVHPSPVASNFYDKLDHKVEMIEAAAHAAVTPDSVVNDIFCSIGACAYRDLGALAWSTRLGTFFIPYNLFTKLFATAAPYLPDWKTHNKHR